MSVLDLLVGPVVTGLAIAGLVVLVLNLFMVPVLGRHFRNGGRAPAKVSVVIPARNEAARIQGCIEAVLAQQGVDLELIVVDDCSDDATFELAEAAAAGAGVRVTVIAGRLPPVGWTGKNWACHQAAAHATAELLCFVDADTQLEPTAIAELARVLDEENADLVSSLVAAEYVTPAQAIFLPMVNHALLVLFPVAAMHWARLPRVALALGPFMLVTRDAYDRVGGHAARRGEIVDDVGMSRAVKLSGGRVRLANGTGVARTGWYPGLRGIWNGFSKNAFGALDRNELLAALTCFGLVPLLVAPFARVALGLAGDGVANEVWLQIALFLVARLVSALAGRDPVWSIVFHPVTVAFWGATLLWSAWLARRGSSVEWRGRSVLVQGG